MPWAEKSKKGEKKGQRLSKKKGQRLGKKGSEAGEGQRLFSL